MVDTPNRIKTEGLNCTVGGIHRVELDAVYKQHLVVQGVDMDDIADGAEGSSGDLDGLGNTGKVLG
jgi:hypothetical protein